MTRDMVFGGGSLAFAVAYYLMADAIPTSALSDAIGPGGLPKAYALVLAGLSVLLLARAIWVSGRARAPAASGGTDWPAQRRAFLRVAGILVIGALYVFAVSWTGYVIALALLIVATAYYQGGALSARLGLVAIVGALFFWLLFVFILRIPQPPGLWPELF